MTTPIQDRNNDIDGQRGAGAGAPTPRQPDTGALAHMDVENLLDIHDAARLLNVTPSWVYEHTRPGCGDTLPAIKLGKYVRFDRRDLLEYIERKREAARLRRRSR